MSEPGLHRLSEIPGLKEAIATHGKASEKVVVAEIVAMLEARGYRKPGKDTEGAIGFYVLAGQRNVHHSGSDSGVVDITVWRVGLTTWSIEVKRREVNTEIKASQWCLWRAGCIHLANTADQVAELLDAGVSA